MLISEVVKTELQSYGVRMPFSAPEGRLGGAGPSDSITLSLHDTLMSVPVFSGFVKNSPYSIRRGNSSYNLYCLDKLIGPVEMTDNSKFYNGITSDGYSYRKLALVHGKNCLASTVWQDCYYQSKRGACSFCGIGLSLKGNSTIAVKTPQQLTETALAFLDKGIDHLLLTSGSTPGGRYEIDHLASCVRALKKATKLPVQVQCMPPRDPGLLALLKESGADTIGLHVESPDEEVLKKHAPAKYTRGWDGYLRGWSKAVELFGRGQVVSYVILGLGESMPRVLNGLEEMINLGVYPYVVPLRPVPGTPVGKLLPPPAEVMRTAYEHAVSRLSEAKLSYRDIKAGCGRCTACSALPDYEERIRTKKKLICRPVNSQTAREKAMAIRRKVFVEEQGLFADTDEDERDLSAVHLVAGYGEEEIVGTVRLYNAGSEVWFGGRLAIAPGHRHNGIGPLLVKTAVEEAAGRGAEKFLAWVQEKNEKFFSDLGWKSTGETKEIKGYRHILMQSEELRRPHRGHTYSPLPRGHSRFPGCVPLP